MLNYNIINFLDLLIDKNKKNISLKKLNNDKKWIKLVNINNNKKEIKSVNINK